MEDQTMQAQVENHERRITKLEDDYRNVISEIGSVKDSVHNEGREQRELLNRLIDHTLGMKKAKQHDRTKIILAIIGVVGGGYGVLSTIYQLTIYFGN